MSNSRSYWFWYQAYLDLTRESETNESVMKPRDDENTKMWGYTIPDEEVTYTIMIVREKEGKTVSNYIYTREITPYTYLLQSTVSLIYDESDRVINAMTMRHDKHAIAAWIGEVAIYRRPMLKWSFLERVATQWKIFYLRRKQARRKIQRWARKILYRPPGRMWVRTFFTFEDQKRIKSVM